MFFDHGLSKTAAWFSVDKGASRSPLILPICLLLRAEVAREEAPPPRQAGGLRPCGGLETGALGAWRAISAWLAVGMWLL